LENVYIIVGAANLPLAYKTSQEELEIGLLLPCNVIVHEADDTNKSDYQYNYHGHTGD
jgi:uncharacterized protein (DUF302 family)